MSERQKRMEEKYFNKKSTIEENCISNNERRLPVKVPLNEKKKIQHTKVPKKLISTATTSGFSDSHNNF